MKIKIYKSLAMCTLLLGLAACNDFEEMNTDPYAPVYDPEIIGATPDGIDIDYELTPSALKSLQGTESAIGSVFANLTYEGLYNDYQVTTNLTHDIYAAYFANNVSGFVTNSPTYGYNDGWSKRRCRRIQPVDQNILVLRKRALSQCVLYDPYLLRIPDLYANRHLWSHSIGILRKRCNAHRRESEIHGSERCIRRYL